MTGGENHNAIVYQGEPGANSHMACKSVYPDLTPRACATFDETFGAVHDGEARYGMIPIENSLAGRVADIHHLLPESGLHIVAEHFQRVNHQLLGLPGASTNDIAEVHSHVHALSQCREFIRGHGIKAVVHADTAGAAADVAKLGDPKVAALASSLAAEIYGLEILEQDVEDADHNTTRFVVMASESQDPGADADAVMTSLIFQVRNVPAALYKALGGFATCGVNIVKLESYQVGGSFNASQFYADIVGHPEHRLVRLALEELEFFTHGVKIVGTYPAHPFREKGGWQ